MKTKVLEPLTAREEEIMQFFWDKGPLHVKSITEFYDDPKPHFNTISTFVRILEEKGYVGHKKEGLRYRYFALISEDEYRNNNLQRVVKKYFNNSYQSAISALIKENGLSVEEVKELLDEVAKGEE